MKILVSCSDEDPAVRLADHAEKLLQRVLDSSCLSIDSVEVRLRRVSGGEGLPAYHCKLTTKMLSGASIRASASDTEAILAVYRAADRVKFLLKQRRQGGSWLQKR